MIKYQLLVAITFAFFEISKALVIHRYLKKKVDMGNATSLISRRSRQNREKPRQTLSVQNSNNITRSDSPPSPSLRHSPVEPISLSPKPLEFNLDKSIPIPLPLDSQQEATSQILNRSSSVSLEDITSPNPNRSPLIVSRAASTEYMSDSIVTKDLQAPRMYISTF